MALVRREISNVYILRTYANSLLSIYHVCYVRTTVMTDETRCITGGGSFISVKINCYKKRRWSVFSDDLASSVAPEDAYYVDKFIKCQMSIFVGNISCTQFIQPNIKRVILNLSCIFTNKCIKLSRLKIEIFKQAGGSSSRFGSGCWMTASV